MAIEYENAEIVFENVQIAIEIATAFAVVNETEIECVSCVSESGLAIPEIVCDFALVNQVIACESGLVYAIGSVVVLSESVTENAI